MKVLTIHDGTVEEVDLDLDALAAPPPALTPREREVLAGIVEGKTDREIAAGLGIALKTEKIYVRKILRTLGARNRVQAAVAAVRTGYRCRGATPRPRCSSHSRCFQP